MTDALPLLRDHLPMIQRIARAYERDHERLRDLVQDIVVAVLRALPGFRGDCDARFFIARIAKNRCADHVALALRDSQLGPLDETDIVETGPGPAHHAQQVEDARRLTAAVDRLPLALRQVAVLALEGMQPAEIAELLGLRPNTAAVRLKRAREALARHLGESR